MFSRAGLWIAIACASFSGCTCGSKGATSETSDGSTATSSESASSGASAGPAGDPSAGAIFSNPIAASHIGDVKADRSAVLVVGLVFPTKTVTALRIESDGHIAWKRDLILGVAWSADAELKAYPIAGGAVVIWRGQRDGKNVKLLVPIDLDGKPLAEPITIGALACTTDDGVAWSDSAAGGKARVRLRTWSTGPAASHEDVGTPIDDDFTLVCGAHRAYAVSEGSDESPARVYAVPTAAPFPLTLGAEVFGHDEERDLLPYADGDDLGVVRVSTSGAIQVADAQQGKAVAFRRNKTRIPSDDDIVAVDADAHAAYVVYTHDESDNCKDNRGGESVHALRIARQGDGDASFVVAPADCGNDAGPFWTGFAGGAFVVAWAERAPGTKSTAPIAALAYRVMDGKAQAQRVAQPADAIVDAGCAGARCYAVALVRAPGSDGMRAEAARVIAYP